VKKKFNLQTGDGVQDIVLNISEMYNVGYAGRDQEVTRKHIEELAALGVDVPKHIPTIYPVSSVNITTDGEIEVIHGKTSGEVEYVIFVSGGKKYISVGSDHSDRALETTSVPMAKQICLNTVADTVWDYDELKTDFDALEMRSYVTKNDAEELYQEGTLAELLAPDQLIEKIESYLGRKLDDAVIYSGTLPTKNGMVYGEKFAYELVDRARDRRLSGAYQIKCLPEPWD